MYTLLDAKTFLSDRNMQASTARDVRDYVRIANDAAGLIRMGAALPCDRVRGTLTFLAAVNGVGTVAVAAGSGTVVGTGTAFSVDHVGRMIYIGGELRPFRITARGSATSITITPVYQGPNAELSGLNYELTDERKALPADFRELEQPDQGSLLYELMPCKDIIDLERFRRLIKYRTIPHYYAIEPVCEAAGATVPAQMVIYPPNTTDTIVDFWYYKRSLPMAADGDHFGIPDVAGAAGMIEAYLVALLFLKLEKMAEYASQLQIATARKSAFVAALMPISEDRPYRHPYRAVEERSRPFKMRFDPSQFNA